MRLRLLLPAFATALLLSSAASAQQGSPFNNGTNGGSNSGSDDDAEDADKAEARPYWQRKSWSVGSSFEVNRTILQEDVGGRNKAFNTLGLWAAYAITRADRVNVQGGFLQRFIADQTETGFRADDIVLSYSHRFVLPGQLNLAPSAGNSFPISFNSRQMGLIALPRASLFLSRGFFDQNLQLSISGTGAYYITEYKTSAAGQINTNPLASTGVRFAFNLSMPFHQPLQIGGSIGTNWMWDQNPDHTNDPVLAEQFKNAPVEPSQDQYFAGRPPGQQSYSGEVYVQYSLPNIGGLNSQFQVSVGQGDGVLRDGATHLYWLSRRGGQVSASLSLSY